MGLYPEMEYSQVVVIQAPETRQCWVRVLRYKIRRTYDVASHPADPVFDSYYSGKANRWRRIGVFV